MSCPCQMHMQYVDRVYFSSSERYVNDQDRIYTNIHYQDYRSSLKIMNTWTGNSEANHYRE